MSSSSTGKAFVNIGILGACWIGPDAVIKPSNLLKHMVRVSSVAARDKKKAEVYAKKHQIPHVHDSYDDLVSDPKIDAIYIGLPNSHHCEWTIKSLKAGKHVLCEKPMANNEEEVRKILSVYHEVNQQREKQKENKLMVMEAFHYRYHPLMREVTRIVKEEMLSKVKHVRAELCIPIFSGSDIRYNYSLGGGALMDTGCYVANAVRYIAGLAGVTDLKVTNASTVLAYPNVDQTSEAFLKSNNDHVDIDVSLKCSIFTLIPSASLQIIAENGVKVSCTNFILPHLLYNSLTVSGHQDSSKNGTQYFEKDRTTYSYQLEAFSNAVLKNDPSFVETTLEDALKNQRVIDEIYNYLKLPIRGTPLQKP